MVKIGNARGAPNAQVCMLWYARNAIWRFVDCGRIANAFPYLLLDILADADDIADGTILIFHTHAHDATAVRHTIKGDMNLNSSFAKFLSNICL